MTPRRNSMPAHLQANVATTVSYLHRWPSKFLKFWADLALSTEWNQELKDQLNWQNHS